MIWLVVGIVLGATVGIIIGGLLSMAKISDYESTLYQYQIKGVHKNEKTD